MTTTIASAIIAIAQLINASSAHADCETRALAYADAAYHMGVDSLEVDGAFESAAEACE